MKPLLLTLFALVLAGCGDTKPDKKKTLEERSPGPKGAGHVNKGPDGKIIEPDTKVVDTKPPIEAVVENAEGTDPAADPDGTLTGTRPDPRVPVGPVGPAATGGSVEAKPVIRPKR